jgi:regulator of sigma E protease
MTVLYSILAFAVVVGIIVLVHEFGHYIAARLTGVRVEVFSFGFGKRIFGKKVGDTDFRFSLLPVGGYVKMAGEEEYDPANLKPDEFHAKNRAQKIFILLMGPVMNVVLTFLIFTIINLSGVEMEAYKKEPPRIGYVETRSPAEQAGLQKGDIIRTIEGRHIANWKDLEITIGSNPNLELPVQYERDGKLRETSLDIKSISRYHVGDAGIYWDFKTRLEVVNQDSPAMKGGLKAGDIILAINEKPLSVYEISEVIGESAGTPLQFKVKRGEAQFATSIVPEKVYFLETKPVDTIKEANQLLKEVEQAVPQYTFNIYRIEGQYRIRSKDQDSAPEPNSPGGLLTPGEKGVIGVQMVPDSPTVTTTYAFFPAMGKSVVDMVDLVDLVYHTIRKMIVGKISPQNLSGPIEIARFSQKAWESGASNFFMLIAFISLQLGIINLFPIPALDGGHLMIFSIEAVIRRDFSPKVKNILMNIGFFILIALMVFIILNDIAKNLPNGWKSLLPF